jgi:hypothetical protein
MAGVLVVVGVAVITWSLFTLLGPAFVGGREAFAEWRTANVSTYYLIYAAAVIAISIPALVIVGQRLQQFEDEQEQAALSARGVGRLAARALRKDKAAIEKLESLLDDHNPAVRYQAARALSLLDETAATKTLLRKVRYWPAPDKLALIDVLKRTHDLRCVPLMEQLAADRNPMIARKARTAMPAVAARAAQMNELEGQARKRSAAQERRNVAARQREARREQTRRQRADQGGAMPAAKHRAPPKDGAAPRGQAVPGDGAVPKDEAAAGDGAAAHAEATTTEADPHE